MSTNLTLIALSLCLAVLIGIRLLRPNMRVRISTPGISIDLEHRGTVSRSSKRKRSNHPRKSK